MIIAAYIRVARTGYYTGAIIALVFLGVMIDTGVLSKQATFKFHYPRNYDTIVGERCAESSSTPTQSSCRRLSIYLAGWLDSLDPNLAKDHEEVFYAQDRVNYLIQGQLIVWSFGSNNNQVVDFTDEFREYIVAWGANDDNVSLASFGPPFYHNIYYFEIDISALRVVELSLSLRAQNENKLLGVIATSNMELNVVEPSDVLLQQRMQSSFNMVFGNAKENVSTKLHFIEIGTSNFDTCLQQSIALYNQGVIKDKISGISIDAVIYYLSQLPMTEDVLKLNVAMTTDKFKTVAEVYTYPYSSIGPYLDENSAGMSTVDRVAPIPFKTEGNESLEKIGSYLWTLKHKLRMYVPALTIDGLMETYVNKLVILFKVDVEGMDYDLVNDLLDFFSKKPPQQHHEVIGHEFKVARPQTTEAVLVNAAWPCVIFFELEHMIQLHIDAITGRLTKVGYRVLLFLPWNAMAVNPFCAEEDHIISFQLLNYTTEERDNYFELLYRPLI